MGIFSVISLAARQISWGQVANLALSYGPDIIRKIKGRGDEARPSETFSSDDVELLREQVRELEALVLRQEEMLSHHSGAIELLEKNGKALQARLSLATAVAAVSLVFSLVLCAIILSQ